MRINGKNILIFPEYHLTDFPPQATLTKNEAYEILMAYEKYGFDVLISGYVERESSNMFSSCIIIDDGKMHNIRKLRPYKDEVKFISPSTDKKHTVNLSIGQSLFIICHEFSLIFKGEYLDIIAQSDIDNLILISAMFHKFEENTKKCINFCKDHKIKRFVTSDRFFGLNVAEIAKIKG
jgi:predicted amidohydrolase